MILEGDIPSPINLPCGCFFNPRCPYNDGLCRERKPELRPMGLWDGEHLAACRLRSGL